MEETTGTKEPEAERSLPRLVLDDIRQTDLRGSLRRDLRDLYRFYLSEDRRAELAGMGTMRGIVWFWIWLVRSLYLKLTPARRVTLLIALVFLSMNRIQWTMGTAEVSIHLGFVGVVLVFIVLMLELKDKLLAHDEIEVARQVQLALLPRSHPTVGGWSIWSHTQPANDVGGDLVDYLDLDGRRVGIVLGDVAGKGLGAALLMSKLQATLRALAPAAISLGDLGNRLNTILVRDGLENRFATLFYFELEPGGSVVRYLNAGHNPPLLVARNGEIRLLRAESPPLGMLAESRYTERTVDLGPRDMLIVYSDGVTEARNDGDMEFGDERLRAVAASLKGADATSAGHGVIEAVQAFIGEVRPHDDLSVVVVARTL
jgi:sigma-B regulation protein RsbU (phosphoserine phosphatase)